MYLLEFRCETSDESQAMNKSYNDEKWEAINLPHTWNAMDG